MATARPMKGPRPAKKSGRRRIILAAGVAGAITILCAGLFVFQDSIARFRLAPRTPFQIETPPPAPDYDARASWALWPDADAGSRGAEVFYVHSTTYYSNARWNAPIGDAASKSELSRNAVPNEVGPFLQLGPVFAPHYRQATLFTKFTHKFDGVAARRLAYADVKRAFERFLKTSDPTLPLVLVGYGQGGLGVQGLLKDFMQTDEALRRRLAAAYVIDQATPLSLFADDLSKTPPCGGPDSIRCVISYVDYEQRFRGEIENVRRRSMAWSGAGELRPTANEALLCTNPLNWRVSTERVEPEAHVGAASATGLALGSAPPAITKIVGAQCVDGILIVDRPVQAFLRRPVWFSSKWRARGFNLFYHDLAADAGRRVAATAAKMEEEYRSLDPIGESVEVDVSPINRTPE